MAIAELARKLATHPSRRTLLIRTVGSVASSVVTAACARLGGTPTPDPRPPFQKIADEANAAAKKAGGWEDQQISPTPDNRLKDIGPSVPLSTVTPADKPQATIAAQNTRIAQLESARSTATPASREALTPNPDRYTFQPPDALGKLEFSYNSTLWEKKGKEHAIVSKATFQGKNGKEPYAYIDIEYLGELPGTINDYFAIQAKQLKEAQYTVGGVFTQVIGNYQAFVLASSYQGESLFHIRVFKDQKGKLWRMDLMRQKMTPSELDNHGEILSSIAVQYPDSSSVKPTAFPAKPAEKSTPVPERRNTEKEHNISLVLEPHASVKTPIKPELFTEERSIIEQRLKALAPSSFNMQTDSQNRILIEVSINRNLQVVVETLGRVGLLEFVNPGSTYLLAGKYIATSEGPPLTDQPWDKSKAYPTILQNRHIKSVAAGVVPGVNDSYRPVLKLNLTDEGAKIFARYTEGNIGTYLSIVMDKEVVSSPVIRGAIKDGKVTIEGSFTPDEANKYITQLNSGPLPFPLRVAQLSVGSKPIESKPTEKPAQVKTEPFSSLNESYGFSLPQNYKRIPDSRMSQVLFLKPPFITERSRILDAFVIEGSQYINPGALLLIPGNLIIATEPVIQGNKLDNYVKQRIVDPMTEIARIDKLHPPQLINLEEKIPNQNAVIVGSSIKLGDGVCQYTTVVFIDRGKAWIINLSTNKEGAEKEYENLTTIIRSFRFRN